MLWDIHQQKTERNKIFGLIMSVSPIGFQRLNAVSILKYGNVCPFNRTVSSGMQMVKYVIWYCSFACNVQHKH